MWRKNGAANEAQLYFLSDIQLINYVMSEFKNDG